MFRTDLGLSYFRTMHFAWSCENGPVDLKCQIELRGKLLMGNDYWHQSVKCHFRAKCPSTDLKVTHVRTKNKH